MTRQVTPDKSDAVAMLSAGSAMGWAELGRAVGLSANTCWRAARMAPITARSYATIRAYLLGKSLPGTHVSCLDCGATVPVAPMRRRTWCDECKATRERKRVQLYREEERKALIQKRSSRGTVAVADCPTCSVRLKRDGALLYCPRRCGHSIFPRKQVTP